MANDLASVESTDSEEFYKFVRQTLIDVRTKDFFETHNLPYPGEISENQRDFLVSFLNPNQKKNCPDGRKKIYKTTHQRLMNREIRIIYTRASYKGKALLGQTGTVIGICGPVTAGPHETTTQNGGARRNVTSQSAFRINVVESKVKVLKVRVRLDSGGTVILSSEEVRDKTLF